MPSGRFLFDFQRRALKDDGMGNVFEGGEFETVFRTYGNSTPDRSGTESVQNGSLTGLQVFAVQIPSSVKSRLVDNTWRAVNVRTGVSYNVVAAVDANGANSNINIVMTSGSNA